MQRMERMRTRNYAGWLLVAVLAGAGCGDCGGGGGDDDDNDTSSSSGGVASSSGPNASSGSSASLTSTSRVSSSGVVSSTSRPPSSGTPSSSSGQASSAKPSSSSGQASSANPSSSGEQASSANPSSSSEQASSANPSSSSGVVTSSSGSNSSSGAECTVPADCPTPENECQTRDCEAGKCVVGHVALNTPVAMQTPGDCKAAVCDGQGNITSINDDEDVPNDNNICTADECSNGTPTHIKEPAGTSCGTNMVCTDQGVCAGCVTAGDCPGVDGECGVRTCNQNQCGFVFTPEGTPVSQQSAGDCKVNQCNGQGGVVPAVDDSDLPVDQKPCTDDVCTNGAPSNPPSATGTACGGTQMCDGQGNCVACNNPSDCFGEDTVCQTRTCANHECGFNYVASGTTVSDPVVGDCMSNQCDGNGTIISAAQLDDLPADDGNQCTTEQCTANGPIHPPVQQGTSCNDNNGSVCNANGQCVQCNTPSQCPGQDTECTVRSCANGSCGFNHVADGTPTSNQTAGDCSKNVCDGQGSIVPAADNTDVPVDGNQCTSDVCTNGQPSNPNVPAGTPCNQNNGTTCDANGACVSTAPTTFAVVRVGDGSAALSNASTAVFIETRTLDGTLVSTLSMPTADSGFNKAFSLSGTATSEGGLTLSVDGHYLALAGYAVAPGTTTVSGSASATVNRVVARIDSAGNIDTRTLLKAAFNTASVRSACTVDGSAFWVTGTSSGTPATAGVHYIGLAAGSSTQVLATPNNTRWCGIYGGQLYATSASTANSVYYYSVFTVGSGLPTNTGNTATILNGLPAASGPSPYGFVMLDVTPNIAGLDTLYIADDRASTSGGGVQKWTFDGTSWTQNSAFSASQTIGVRAVAAMNTGAVVNLIATTASDANNPSRVIVLVDDGVNAPTPTVIATVSTNTVYRGIAFSPH